MRPKPARAQAPLATIQQAVAAVMQDYQDGNLADWTLNGLPTLGINDESLDGPR